jgi:nucleoside-diphosphate-sugar epimerase
LSERGYDIELEYLDIKDIRNYKVDITKIEEELDYAPRFTPVDTVQEILENINLDEYDFSDDKYYNINVFKKVM